jgi:hypothetical protein
MMDGEKINRCKLGRLPVELRHELNKRIRANELSTTLLPWLNSLPETLAILRPESGESPVTIKNLSDWRQSGYRDWLERRERIEERREMADYCFELAQSGKNLLDGSASVLGAKLMEIMEGVDTEAQRGLLAEKPDNLVGLISGLAALQGQANQGYKIKQTDRRLDLEERKFEGRFLKLFEQYYADRQVQEIMAGKDGARVKMEQLRTHIFGARPSKEGAP